MIRDKWIYQKRQVAHPWAIYLVANDDRLTKRTKDIAYTIYSEEIENEWHSMDAIDVNPATAFIEIDSNINEFVTSYTAADFEQIKKELQEFIR